MSEHTPVPWAYHSGSIWKPNGTAEGGIPIAHMNRSTPYTLPTERDANARFIVRACNNFEALLATAEAMLEHSWAHYENAPDARREYYEVCVDEFDQLRAAVEQAKGL